METTQPRMVPHLWKTALVAGLLALILGGLILWRPGAAIFVTAIFFGAYLLITGFSQVALAFSLRTSVGGRVLLFIGGAAALALAVLCFINFSNSIELLAIWIGIGFVFRGVATLMSSVSDPALPGRVWQMVVGALGVLAGIVMFAWPMEGLVAITQVTGIILIFLGAVEIVTAFGIRTASKSLEGTGQAPPAPAAEAPVS